MVVDWEQETGLLMSSGDVRIVRVWDTEREMKVQVGGSGANGACLMLFCPRTHPTQELVLAP